MIIYGIYFRGIAGKKRCLVLFIQNEARKINLNLKKLPENLESTALIFPDSLKEFPIVVFFEDETRFERISREMACWVKKEMIPSVAKQMIREYI